MWNLLIVLISLTLSAPMHLAAPPGNVSNPLLEGRFLPILNQCSTADTDNVVKNLCSLYAAIVKNATATVNFTRDFEAYSANPESNVKGFCENLIQFQGVQQYMPNVTLCMKQCTTYTSDWTEIAKPLCRLIQWRLEVQGVGRISPQAGEIPAPHSTQPGQGGTPTAKTAVVVNTTTQGLGENQELKQPPLEGKNPVKDAEIPPEISGGEKIVITPALPPKLPTESGTTSTKTLNEPPKEVKEAKEVLLPEDINAEPPKVDAEVPKENPEVPKNDAEVKASNSPGKEEEPKPVEEVKEEQKPAEEAKKEPQDLEEDSNEGIKDMEDDDNHDEYMNVGDREEQPSIVKGNTNNFDLSDPDPVFGGSDVKEKPMEDKMEVVDGQRDPFQEEDESNFFTYFMCVMIVCIIAYVVYHNKTKVLALLLEGRRSSQGRGRRKHTAAYRKLDSNLEEAITSSAASRTTQIIY
ncbi:uncharacterized protein LOC129795404 [Lutzomyia longipalpis]|uniref:uncharacterized protein LOC129795404 n=1 Tax=Lutzomyia longipalpis TaxID=7200 RepID=UPI002483559F|nr:uncharacterized protein LOC129795404 [Lutzomyia longipalpis]